MSGYARSAPGSAPSGRRLAAGVSRVERERTDQEDRVVLVHRQRADRAELVGRRLVQLDIELVGEDLTAGEDGEVAEDRLAVVAKAGRLDGGDLELTAQLVQDAGGQRLAVDVLGDDDKRAALLGGNLERREDVLQRRDLLLRQQDERLLVLDLRQSEQAFVR